MKTAFPYWHNRIAPVFDTARQILIVESESGVVIRETRVILPDEDPSGKVLRLVESGSDSLVCGALSRPVFLMAAAYGIKVTPFVAGNLEEIIDSWVAGTLQHDTYAMPGCRMRRTRRSRGTASLGGAPEESEPRDGQVSQCSREEQHAGHPVCHAAPRRRKR